MIAVSTLQIMLAVESALLLIAFLLLVVHGIWLSVNARRRARQTLAARAVIIPMLTAPATNGATDDGVAAHAAAIAALRAMSPDFVADVCLEMSRDLTGAGNTALRELASEAGLLTRAQRECHSRWWSRRLHGARLLSQLGGPDPVVRTLLRDEHPAVRMQTVEWAAGLGTPELIDDIVELLALPELHSRFAVQDAVLRIGDPAIESLVQYLDSHTGTAASAGLDVARTMPDARFLPAAINGLASDSAGVRSSAVRLLGIIGGSDGATRLADLLDDEDAEVRVEAAKALGRTHHWPASSRLARAMEDSSWDVRYAAGEALRAMGAPGLLQLRRLRGSPDRYAAGMAKLILGIPETTP